MGTIAVAFVGAFALWAWIWGGRSAGVVDDGCVIERERQRLRKEEQHFRQAIAQLQAKGDTEGVERLRAQLAAVVGEMEAVDFRARTLTAGHVYVISNIGSFGKGCSRSA